MKSWHWNGSAFEAHDSVPVEDRGFRYGMALFESLRVWRQRPLFLEQHLQRLRHACAERHFPIDENAFTQIDPLLRDAGMDGFARIYVTAGDGPATELPRASRIFVLLEDRECPRLDPCNATISPEPHRPLFGGLKTANYWGNIEALHRAMREGKDDALLFNDQAELISACMANVFVVHRTKLRTPALPCGARDGVVRAWVLQQVRVKEGSLFIEDLQTADEIFITNSWLGLRSVGRIASRELPSRAVCERLSIAYERAIEAD
ncbi:MAG TPA: aminotransferase class IV [Chthoniobacteraceae bacterium]